jgi:hypothetical protein
VKSGGSLISACDDAAGGGAEASGAWIWIQDFVREDDVPWGEFPLLGAGAIAFVGRISERTCSEILIPWGPRFEGG